MAAPSTVRILFNRLPHLAAELKPRAAAIRHEQALEIIATAKALVRVDTGELRDSIRILEETSRDAVVGTEVEHGVYNEFGTVHMAAQPFMTPAVEAARPRYVARMKKLLD